MLDAGVVKRLDVVFHADVVECEWDEIVFEQKRRVVLVLGGRVRLEHLSLRQYKELAAL